MVVTTKKLLESAHTSKTNINYHSYNKLSQVINSIPSKENFKIPKTASEIF